MIILWIDLIPLYILAYAFLLLVFDQILC